MNNISGLVSGKRKHVAGAIASMSLVAFATVSLSAPSPASGMGGFSQIGNALAMLASRSPGERTTGELVNIKPVASGAPALADSGPRQRLLARSLPPGAGVGTAGLPGDGIAGLIVPPVPVIGDDLLAPGAPDSLPGNLPIFGGIPIIGGGGGFVGSPGTGGGGGGGGGTPGNPVPPVTPPVVPPVTPPVVPPVSAVPEPETWALMLLGMGLCGLVLRRRKRPVIFKTA